MKAIRPFKVNLFKLMETEGVFGVYSMTGGA